MEDIQEVVIVGAGVAGLASALGLHRLGLKSLVLESSDCLRVTGYAFLTWTNAWRALDALGIGDLLRQKHHQLEGFAVSSLATGLPITKISFTSNPRGTIELRGVKRKLLLETLFQELPQGTVIFGSKVVDIDQSKDLTLVHLADGSILKTKVLIGCDGVNSLVSRWLGLSKPSYAGRSGFRGLADLPEVVGFKSFFHVYSGCGYNYGLVPCDEKFLYWFFAYTPSHEQVEEDESNPMKIKQFVLSKLGMVPQHIRDVVENTRVDSLTSSPFRYRKPWELLWGKMCKGGVTVAGDALHPMTPDIGQGACSALEDGVALARCIGEAFSIKNRVQVQEPESERIRKGLEKYVKERRWRGFELVTTALLFGWAHERGGYFMNFVRDKLCYPFLSQRVFKLTFFDVGKLENAS